MPLIVKSLLRHTKEMYGTRIPGDTIFAIDDIGLYDRLLRDKVIEPWEIPIIRPSVKLPPANKEWAPDAPEPIPIDICVIARWTRDGVGGGEASIRAKVRNLREAGYSVLWNTVEDFYFLVQRGCISPRVVMARGDTPPDVLEFIRAACPGALAVFSLHSILHPKCMGGWDLYICNSEFTERWAKEHGATETLVRYPALSPDRCRCEKVTPNYVLATNIKQGKGGDIVRALARQMPDVQFVGIDFELREPEREGNLTILPWCWDMRPAYSGAAVVIQNTVIPESYGKTCVEAAGNGIPCVVSDSGFLPEQAARFPELLEVVPSDALLSTWEAAVRAGIAKGIGKPHDEVWEVCHRPVVEWLAKHGYEPSHTRPPLRMIRLGGHMVGIGDAIMLYPTLEELSKHFTLFYDPASYGQPAPGRAILENCQYLEKKPCPPVHIPYVLEPIDKTEPPALYTSEPRHLSYARRACVEPESWHPEMFTVPDGKKVIGVCLWANCSQRTMPDEYAKALIEKLKTLYTVVLIDKAPHSEYEGVIDIGGKFSISFLPLIVRKLDAVVSVDTGIAHIAGARHVPFIVLLGAVAPGVAASYEMYDVVKRQLFLGLDCSPCWMRGKMYGCEGEPECLKFAPEPILKAVGELLG